MTMKTHHWGILAQLGSAALIAFQSYHGETVNAYDPAVWSEVFGFIMTIVGLIRNNPQPA